MTSTNHSTLSKEDQAHEKRVQKFFEECMVSDPEFYREVCAILPPVLTERQLAARRAKEVPLGDR